MATPLLPDLKNNRANLDQKDDLVLMQVEDAFVLASGRFCFHLEDDFVFGRGQRLFCRPVVRDDLVLEKDALDL